MKSLWTILLIALLAPAALAEVKVYDSTPPGGTPGDRILVAATLCPTTQPTPGLLKGFARLEDDGSGTVTMNELSIQLPQLVDIDTTLVFGPGSFIFIDAEVTTTPDPAQTGTGSTAKTTGSVTWGVLSGWATTGRNFCVSSPPATCNNNGFLHGVTSPPPPLSPTYDLGTWTFDAEGDYEGTSYIQATFNGGVANQNYDLRGTFVGAGLPALPLVGFAAMAAGLLALGARTVLKRK